MLSVTQKLLSEWYNISQHILHNIKGDIGTFGELPSGSTSLTELTELLNMPIFIHYIKLDLTLPKKKIQIMY